MVSIYNFLYLKYVFFLFSNPDAAQYLSFASIRCSMQRQRTKSLPPVPDTLTSLRDILEDYDILKNVYKESVTTNDGKTAIILSTNYLLKALSSATELFVDGTFSVSIITFFYIKFQQKGSIINISMVNVTVYSNIYY